MQPCLRMMLLVLASAGPALAASHYRDVANEAAPVYFGHVSYCELRGDAADPRVDRGERAEPAEVNVPLTPGDRVLTPAGRRCEAQFDTGTLVRLDGGTALRVEAVLASSLSSSRNLTNLVLETGRLRVSYRDYDAYEVFQVLMPNLAVRFDRGAIATLSADAGGASTVSVESGRVALLYGSGPARTRSRKLKSGESVRVSASDALEPAPVSEATSAFAAWNRDLDTRFVEMHAGRSKLPKPVYKYPRAIVHFAERWSSAYGEWIWTDFYGYAWRPYLSQHEGWRPYLMGRWTPVDGRMFWVPQEPWGWVPYHLGLWHWDTRAGWMWLPGSRFAPAWVTWTNCEDHVAWQPFGLWDWWGWPDRPPGPLDGPYTYAYTERGLGRCGLPYFGWPGNQPQWATTPVGGDMAAAAPPAPAPTPAPEPEDARPRPPREIRKLSESFAKRIQQGDPDALESVRRIAGSVGVVPRPARPAADDERHPAGAAERPEARLAVPAGERSPVEPDSNATPTAAYTERRPDAHSAPARGAEARFRDWNPDVRAAREVGGHIRYDSERNAIRCEGCRRPLTRPAWADGPTQAGASGATGLADAGSGSSSGGAGVAGGGGAAGANRDAGGGQDRTKQQ